MLTAQGTRLNRRGLETRRRIIETAVACLAAEGPEAASANYIARRAGTTWGTIQHQFGGVDGLWAAIIEDGGLKMMGRFEQLKDTGMPVAGRVRGIVAAVWELFDRPESQATQNIRIGLPRAPETLKADFPATYRALTSVDREWRRVWVDAFVDLDIPPAKIQGIRQLLPGAIRGLHTENRLIGYTDVPEALSVLADAIVAYLNMPVAA
jgi:AcrR family transcriptional regulator